MKTINTLFFVVLLFAIICVNNTEANQSGTGLISESPLDLNPPVFSYTPLLNTNSTSVRTLIVTITDADGVPTSGAGLPVLYWNVNNGSWSSATGTYISGNDYQFLFGGGVSVADVVYYYIVAQDLASTPNVIASPSGGAGGYSANPPAASVPPAFPNNYTVTYAPLSGDISVGLTAFNKITGKNISFKKETKKVLKSVILLTPENNGKPKHGILNTKYEKVTVDETQWIPMENGRKYNGQLYILKAEHPEFNFPANINGIYATITGAVSDLNFRGVNGPVRFLLDDASFTTGESFPIVINLANDNLTTPVNTVVIKPNTGVTTSVSGTADYNPVFRILSNYITVDGSNTINGTTRDLTISNNSVLSPGVIAFTSNGTAPVTGSGVKNCNLINGINTGSAIVMTDFSFSDGYFDNITIQNNNIQNAYFGIYGTSASSSGNGLNISGNALNTPGVNAIRHFGIYLRGFSSAVISSNDIANFENTTDEIDNGIWIDAGTKNTVIEKNKIYNLGYTGSNGYCAQGIAVSTGVSPANIIIKNNVFYNIYGVGYDYVGNLGNNPMGIYLYGPQTGIQIYNNSINLYGNTLNLGLAMSIGICLGSGTTADIRNNNIVNNLGLSGSTGYGSCAIYAQSDNTQFTDINFNNYFVKPAGGGMQAVGKISTTRTSSTLSDWVTATGKDEFSITSDPGFTSPSNLMPDVNNANCWNINAGAMPLSNVSGDINNNPRSTSVSNGACDIGAYEFTPAASANNLTISGSITDNGTSVIYFAGSVLSTITWHANSGTLPSSVSAVFEPGIDPQNVVLGSNYANENFTISVPDGSGYLYDIEYKYNLARMGTITTENFIRIAKYSASTWVQYPSAPNTSTKTIDVTGLNSFSVFSFGDENAPLPVNLTSFVSNVNGRNVKLTWITASEINNAGFEIQRTLSGSSAWAKIGFLPGNKNKQTPSSYNFDDNNLNPGKYNYRLKQIDLNGNYKYYNLNGIVEIGIPEKFDVSQNYPNPFNPSTKIKYELAQNSFVNLVIYDAIGRKVETLVKEKQSAGTYEVTFNASAFPSGVYYYRFSTESFNDTKRMILIK
jgi:hypothetical protein